jgi:uncharacterized protein YceH (UPF0502 family)
VTRLPRRPGEKEARYAQLLSGVPEMAPSAPERVADPVAAPRSDRMAELEAEVARLRSEFEDLKQQFAGFQKQFE